MKRELFGIALCCFWILVGTNGCTKKTNASVAASQNPQPPSQNSEPASQVSTSPLDGWQKFSSSDGKFLVLLPGPPEEREQAVQGRNGKIELHMYVAAKGINDSYEVGYYDFAEVSDPKLLLADLEALIVAGQQGKVVYFRRFQLQNCPGTEFEFVDGRQANYSVRTRLILVGRRAYSLATVFLTAEPHPEERDAFFNSFSLEQN